jgi:hypothetical protein
MKQFFHRAPWMQQAQSFLRECEIVTATGRLIMDSIYRETRTVTEQQGTDGAMADEENVAFVISR